MFLSRYKGLCAGVALSVVMAGCSSKNSDEKGPQKPTTVGEDKLQLTQTRTNLFNCLKNIKDGSFIQSVISTTGLKDGDFANETWLNDLSDAMDNAFVGVELDNESRFDFAHWAGKYTYNATTKAFEKTASADIVVTFPSSPAAGKNDYVFTITGYKDAKFQVNMENIYLPTACKASLTKDGTTLFSLDYTGSFSAGSFPIPQAVQLKLSLKPHDYLIKVNKITNTQFAAVVELQSGSDCVTAFNGKVSFANEDYNNLSLSEDLVSVEGLLEKGSLNVKGSWDAKKYYKLPTYKAADINSTISIFGYNGTDKTSEFRYKDNASGGYDLYVFYKDQTSDLATVYSDPFIADLKGMLKPYFGTDVDSWFEMRAKSQGSFSKKITKIKNTLSDWVNKTK
ncbi:hypothetical protein ACE38W_11285 [Chitinophaga sp. Hz27]|uniref:hypothetical protein n=1 Tax=Chitinophaga sp. Hz27 TaxID=3347169 RepID=UPI0035E1045D